MRARSYILLPRPYVLEHFFKGPLVTVGHYSNLPDATKRSKPQSTCHDLSGASCPPLAASHDVNLEHRLVSSQLPPCVDEPRLRHATISGVHGTSWNLGVAPSGWSHVGGGLQQQPTVAEPQVLVGLADHTRHASKPECSTSSHAAGRRTSTCLHAPPTQHGLLTTGARSAHTTAWMWPAHHHLAHGSMPGRSPWTGSVVGGSGSSSTSTSSTRSISGISSMVDVAEHAPRLLAAIKSPISFALLRDQLCHALGQARDGHHGGGHPEGPAQAALLEALTGLLMSQLDHLTGGELAQVLWAYTVLGVRHMPLFARITEALYNQLAAMSGSDLAMVMWALAVNNMYDHEMFAAISEFVWEQLPGMNPHQLAVVAAAYATFGHYDDDQDLFNGLADQMRRKLQLASPADVALVLKALAVLQHNSPALMAAATQTLLESGKLAALLPSQLADVLWACTVLRHRDTDFVDAAAAAFLDARLDERPFTFTATPPIPPGLARTVPDAPDPTRADGKLLDMQHLEEHAPLPDPRTHPTPPKSTPSSTPTSTPPGAPSAASFTSTSAAPSAAGQHLSGHEASHGHVWHHHIRSAGAGGPRKWATAAAGHSTLLTNCLEHDPTWLPRQQRSSDQHLQNGGEDTDEHAQQPPAGAAAPGDGAPPLELVSVDVLARFVWSFALLEHSDMRMFVAVFRVLQRLRPDALDCSSASMLLMASIKLQEKQPGAVPLKFFEAQSYPGWVRSSRQQVSQLRLPDALLPRAFVALQSDVGHQEDMNKYNTWRFRLEEGLGKSSLHRSLLATLRAMGLQPLCAAATLDGLPVTIGVSWRSLTVAVEPLDPSECMRDPPHDALGPVVARLESLKFRGWSVLTVPYHEWASLNPGEQARQEYLRAKLEHMERDAHP